MNHHSWWDGFFAYVLNKHLWGKRFHILMLAKQLQRFSFFQKLGAIGIEKKSTKSILATLKFMNSLLENAQNLLTFYPQGEIRPSFESFYAEPGYKRIAQSADNLIAAHSIIEYASTRKPVVHIYISELNKEQDLNDQWKRIKETAEKAISADISGINLLEKGRL
jgi:hypothetical protein